MYPHKNTDDFFQGHEVAYHSPRAFCAVFSPESRLSLKFSLFKLQSSVLGGFVCVVWVVLFGFSPPL